MPETNQTLQSVLDRYGDFLERRTGQDASQSVFFLEEAIEKAGELNRPALLAALLLKLGCFLLESTGRIQDAVHAFTGGGLRLQDDPRYREEMHEALDQLQGMRKGYSGSSEALPDIYLLDAEEDLLRAEEDPLLHVKLIVNAGFCYLEMGQEEPALGYFREARKLPSIAGSPMIRARVLANEAELWRRRGDLQQAGKLLDAAGNDIEQLDREVEAKEFYAVLARLRQQEGRRTEAIERYEKAAALYEQTTDRKGHGRTLTRLAQLYLEEEDISDAKKHFRRALGLAEATNDENNQAFAHRGLALCYLQEKNPEKVIEHLEACLHSLDKVVATLRTEQGKLSRIDSMEGAMNTLLDNYLAQFQAGAGKEDLAHVILQKIDKLHGLILDDILQGVVQANQVTKEIEPGEEDPGFPDLSGQHMNMMVQQAAADYTPFPSSRTVERPKRDEVEPLPRLVYHLTEENLIIVLDRPGEAPFVLGQSLSRTMVRRKVERLLRSLHAGRDARGFRGILSFDRSLGVQPDDQALLRELYDWLIGPVAGLLPKTGSLLVVEPHDTLHLAPFAALEDEDGLCFGEKYPLLLSPSEDALRRLRSYQPYNKELKKAGALIVGNPEMKATIEVNGKTYDGFTALDGAEREAAFIQELFPKQQTTYLKNAGATAEAIQEAARESGLIHLATHGVADEAEPMSSFLLVAGGKGYLTARELRNWRLSADLVVLSACETALGRLANTEGVIGLARALFIAGARAVLVSLWPVHDRATALLMEYFYRALLAGEPIPNALQTAQLKLKAQSNYAEPVFWAGFVAMGAF